LRETGHQDHVDPPPYNKNTTAKQERKHLLVAQILKRLHGGHPSTWDQHLPLAASRTPPAQHHVGTCRVHSLGDGLRPLSQSTLGSEPEPRHDGQPIQTSLSAIWQELDTSGVIAYQQSFAKMNKGRKPTRESRPCLGQVITSCTASHARRRTMPPESCSYRVVRPMENRTAPAEQRV
jgi:hypothetical protein